VAICDNRIEAVDEHGVTYQVKPSGSSGGHKTVTRQAEGEPFVRSFVQHILPRGFQKVRYYGWMSPNCKLQLANVRWLAWLWRGWTYWLGSAMFQPLLCKPPVLKCQHCGDELELTAITNQVGATIWKRQTSLPSSQRGPP
jgi:hypothetical protein